MARPRQPPQEPQPQPPPAALPPGQVADRLGMATGAAAAAAAAAPPAAGAVAGVVAPAAVAAASKKIVEGFVRFFKQRRRDEAIFLFTALREGYPQRTVREIDDLVSREMQREAEFYRRAQERLERDLPKALSIPNREKRAEAVTRLLERERRYVKQREQAAVERSAYRAEMIDVKKASPLGAFWKLDPTVQQHTLDCLLMGEKFWPWEVLDDYHPQLHPGCMCHLLTHREAVERGYISEDFQPDVQDAIASARSIIERVGRAQESAWPSEIEAFLYELLLEAKVGHRVGYDEETEQIKKRAERPEAKARHEFKPAIWTHRNGHPRCRVCGDEEPVGGICNGKPTREEAQAWADKQAREGWGGWYVADDGSLKLDLQEAAVWAERLHPRDRSGRWRDVAWQRYRMIGQRENVHHAEVSDVEQEVLGEMIARLPERARTRVKYSDIRGEQHVHSNYSDGHNSIHHIAEQALKHGHQHVVISDHAHHLTPETVRKQHQEIDRLNHEFAGRLKIVKGIEANIDEQGNVTGPAGVSLDQFEHVNAGLHHDKHANAHERLMKALDDPRVHALAHPHTSDNVHYGELAKKAAEKGVALELNARDVLRNERDPHAARMVRAAIRHGARLQITSDSHQADSDFTDTRYAVELARRNGVKAHHLYHYGDRRLQEASWDERWPKGDVRGGQFRPRRGGIRRSVRRSLRGLVKELPQIATQAHPQGRYVWLRGRHVFVPRGRTFHRRIDGVSFHSPAGSTNIYRDGKLVQIEGQAPPPHHADLDVPLVPDPRLLSDTAKYDPGVKGGGEWPWMENLTPEQAETALAAMQVGEQERERLNEKLGVALETMPEESPISVGDSMPEVGDLLEVHGFIPSSSEQTWENGDHVRKWKHAQSGAYLSILWNDRTAKVRDVTWIPGRKDWATPEPPINHRPQSWDEFTDEIRGVAYRLAHDNNDTPVVGEVRYVEAIGDHSGFHHSKTGLIELGAEVPAVIRLSERRRAGQMASPEERRSAYRGYKVAVHEAIHGAGNVIPALVYARPEGKGIEEALTEELAHIETVSLLRAHGANEVLEWMRQHPNDYGVVGTYHTFRQAMDEMMNRAKIAPELREDYLRDLKWNVPSNERVAKIARDLVDAGAEPDFKDANTYVLSRFTTAKKEEEFGVSYFAPILRPNLIDYPAADGVVWNDSRIREGSIVTFKLGGEEHDGVVQQVEQANQPGTKFKLNVRTADQKLHRHVLDSMVMDVMPGLPREENQQQIEMNPTVEVLGQHVGVGARIRMKSGPHMKVEGEVALVDPDNNLRVWIHPTREQDPTYDDYVYEEGSYIDVKPDEIGAVLQASDPPTVIKTGSLIHYDGRADNGISEARVTNIVDLGVHRYAPAHIPRHAIEAVTTENSLSPGKLVYLTPDRMNGVSVVAEERGLAPVTQLPVSTPRPEPLAVAADLPEPEPYVDLKTVPIQTAAGPLTFYEHHGDAIGPEYHQDLVATNADGINVGYVSVAFLGDTAAIKMIEVAPEFRRKGVASALIQHIRREHPGVNIETLGDVATPEGQAFVASGRRSSNVAYEEPKSDMPSPIWRMPRAEYVGPFEAQAEGESNDEAFDRFQVRRSREREWNAAIRRALSLGMVSFDDARALGYNGVGADNPSLIMQGGVPVGGWQPLPDRLWHVTTAAASVRAGGLRTRSELSQERGAGLGGGEEDTISFTTDPEIAADIERGIKEMRLVARGEITVADMIERARTGDAGSQPFLAKFMRGYKNDWMEGDPLPQGIEDAVAGVKRGNTLGRIANPVGTPDEVIAKLNEADPGDWRMEPDAQPAIPDAPRGAIYSGASFVRTLTPQENREQAVELYKRFLGWRDFAGGPSDPVFFLADTEGLAAIPEGEIATLEFRPTPNGRGYPMSGMKEWRTGAGEAVVLAEDAKGDAPMAMERSWHLTDNPNFAFDPARVGQVNSTLGGEMDEPGIFVTKQPEFWFNRHDYVRPFIAEIEHPAGLGGGYYEHQDNYLPAALYDKSRIVRVIPVDEYVREHFREPGWIEAHHGDIPEEFKVSRTPGMLGDYYRLPEGYRYTGPDVRDMSPAEQQRHFDRVRDYIEQSDRKYTMLRKYDDRGEIAPDFEKWVWPHERDTGRKGDPGEPQVRVPPSRHLTVPKSGKLREPALSALAAIDGLLRVPEMDGPIPVRATAGKNTRGGYLRKAPEGTPEGPKWEGPTVRVSGFGKGRGILPAKRADELQPGDEVLMSGGYRMKVTAAERIETDPGFGRPLVEKISLTFDRGEEWGDSRLHTSTHKPEEMFGFNWKPPAEDVPEAPDLLPQEIRVSVQESEQAWAAEATLVHEVGHYLDNQAFVRWHRNVGFASDHAGYASRLEETRRKMWAAAGRNRPLIEQYESTEPLLADWYAAVQRTIEFEGLQSASIMEMETHKYLLSPREMWARSFAQWVALRSGDPALKEWLDAAQNVPEKMTAYRKQFDREQRKNVDVPYETTTPNYIKLRQWQDDSFAPVAEAMDRLFDGLGWRHGAETGGRGDGDTDSGERRDVGARPGGGDAAEFAAAANVGRVEGAGDREAVTGSTVRPGDSIVIQRTHIQGVGDTWWVPQPSKLRVDDLTAVVRDDNGRLVVDAPDGTVVRVPTGSSKMVRMRASEQRAHWWPHPIPVDPPKLKLLGSGVYESEDGRITMYRIEGVRPYAWNVEWTIDYENAVAQHGQHSGLWDGALYASIVDGAGSKKDALEIFRDEWEQTRANIVAFETGLRESAVEPPEATPPGGEDGVEGTDGMRPDGPVQLLLEAVHVPEHERGDVIAKLLLLDDEERVGFVDGWLLEADSDLSVASILGS